MYGNFDIFKCFLEFYKLQVCFAILHWIIGETYTLGCDLEVS